MQRLAVAPRKEAGEGGEEPALGIGRSSPAHLPSQDGDLLPEELVLPVKVDGNGIVTVAGKKIDRADLPKLIAKKQASEPKLVVTLHTDKDTRYGAFLQVLQALRNGGADKIAILDPGR